MKKVIKLVEAEIARVEKLIDRHKGVGCYQQNCVVWQHHLTAYAKILEMLMESRRR